jgi:DNA-binding protein HU-beta
MSADLKEIPEKLLQVLERGGFRKLNSLEIPTHFGNELEIFGSPSMQLRLIKDRGQWSIELGPADLSGEWYDLQDVLSVAGSSEEISSFDLDPLAKTLTENFQKIREIFDNYSQHREALKHAAEASSSALMDEIFSGPKRTTEQGSKYRKPPVSLVEAVQKQLGSETSKAEAERAVTAVINAVKVGVKKDKMVQLYGFGTFKVVETKARKIVDPKTLRKVRNPKSKTVKFVPSKAFESETL